MGLRYRKFLGIIFVVETVAGPPFTVVCILYGFRTGTRKWEAASEIPFSQPPSDLIVLF